MRRLLFFLLLTLCSSASETQYAQGEKLYNIACISCHGINGEALTGIKLIVNPRKLTNSILSQQQSFQIIKKGAYYWGAHSDMMPSFESIFSDAEIDAISFYVKEAFNKNLEKKITALLKEEKMQPEESADILALGKKIFHKRCAKCHGETGDGQSSFVEVSKQHKEFIYPYDLQRTILNENQIFLFTKYGGDYWGSKTSDMPSWKEKYNDFQLKAVAKYIHNNIKKADK